MTVETKLPCPARIASPHGSSKCAMQVSHDPLRRDPCRNCIAQTRLSCLHGNGSAHLFPTHRHSLAAVPASNTKPTLNTAAVHRACVLAVCAPGRTQTIRMAHQQLFRSSRLSPLACCIHNRENNSISLFFLYLYE